MGRMNKRIGQGFKSKKQRDKLLCISKANSKPSRHIHLDHTYYHGDSRPAIDNVQCEYVVEATNTTIDSRSACTPLRTSSDWEQGRRIVELGVIAEGLKGCKKCGSPLHLHHASGIITYGLCAVIKVVCSNTNCHFVNQIPTGKKHGKIWDANSKLATAMVHTGTTTSQINGILSTLNIPPVSYNTIQNRLNEAGLCVEDVALESSNEFLQKEHDESGAIIASVDAGWQRRGSGRSYDSLSGHCSMFGCKTGKIINYAVRSKTCRICESSEKKCQTPKCHDCRRNFDGSAKSMESDMVVGMVEQNKESGIKTEAIIADDDSTTISRLRAKVDPNIQKYSDKNHVKKNLSNSLYALRKTHKSLSCKVIRYLMKCFSYAIAQNQGNPDGLLSALSALYQHPFGEHKNCPTTWCSFQSDPTRKHKSLPFGKPLVDKALQDSLANLVTSYSKHADKLANLKSTQANESFNRLVSLKAPKAHHFSGSANLNFRVAASVAQRNIGHTYLLKVHKRLGISPGEHTRKTSILKDIQAHKKKAIATTVAAKRKRNQLKAKRLQSASSVETREGVSYESGVDLDTRNQHITEIPPPSWKPNIEHLSAEGHLIFFDLEATGLDRESHITQMALANENSQECFYVFPKEPITTQASKITGITVRGHQLFHHGKPVEGKSVKEALQLLLQFCSSLTGKNVLLVGHNVRVYDCPILLNALEKCGQLEAFSACVSGFLDTRKLFQLTHPGQTSYAQQHLVKSLLGTTYDAHDALEDVMSLKALVNSQDVSKTNMYDSTFTVSFAVQSLHHSKRIKRNIPSLQCLVDSKCVSATTARTIAGSGLRLDHLQLVYQRNGRDGIESLFAERGEGKSIRVTKSQKIIDAVCGYLSQCCSED